jgi:RsiW-degrading membrane proteinase PrsW (M82 family)
MACSMRASRGSPAYFIGVAHWYRKAAWALIAIGLALTAVLHGLYNASSNNWLGALVAACIVFLFLGYVRSGDEIALDRSTSRLGSTLHGDAFTVPGSLPLGERSHLRVRSLDV